jgi:ribosomal protein S12 methylthiotransferase
MTAHKRSGSCRTLVVAGCWVEREGEPLKSRFPDVDLWLGILTPERIRWLVRRVLKKSHAGGCPADKLGPLGVEAGRLRLTPAHWAYLKIADGCDNCCTYCTIPEIRGCLRSKPPGAVVEEARILASEGVKELVLIAQDITAYGSERGGTGRLLPLLRDLAAVRGVEWIRLMYTHPAHFTHDLVGLIESEPKICHYMDLPIQHICDRILAAMGRKVTRAGVESLVSTLRRRLPDVVIRTSIIVGFPGENDKEFAELMDFLRGVRFERLGCFAYSPEVGTPAASMPGQVPPDERARRADEVMKLQQEIAFESAKAWVGREVAVIVDGPAPERGESVGRTYGDAPEIDPVIYLKGKHPAGYIGRARVTAGRGYDLVGTLSDGNARTPL